MDVDSSGVCVSKFAVLGCEIFADCEHVADVMHREGEEVDAVGDRGLSGAGVLEGGLEGKGCD